MTKHGLSEKKRQGKNSVSSPIRFIDAPSRLSKKGTASAIFRFKAKRLHSKQANFVVLSYPDLLTPRERTVFICQECDTAHKRILNICVK